MVARVVPVPSAADPLQWLLSGVCLPIPRAQREVALRTAAQTAVNNPRLVYRNPALLARGWELQRAQHDAFVAHFGSDAVVLSYAEYPARIREYWAGRAAPGVAEQFLASTAFHPATRTVGLVSHERTGLGVYGDYGMVEEAFAEPERMRDRKVRRTVRSYLDAEEIGPHALTRLAERDHAKADRVFARVTNRPRFRWSEDGEALLRQRKPSWSAEPQLPSSTLITERLRPYVVPDGRSGVTR